MSRDAYREQVVGKLNAAAESAGRKVVRPEDLRPGDRVRYSDAPPIRAVYRVTSIGVEFSGGGMAAFESVNTGWTRTWELIERPKPEARLGSVWVDPDADVRFVALFGGVFVSDNGAVTLRPQNRDDAQLIARLVPAEGEA